jgi:predicted ribosomally synthesized peptide with SipW-like signal peptide
MKSLTRGPARKILLTVAAFGVAAAMATLGTFAAFTSTTSASQDVASGTVTIALGATGASTNRLTVAASGLVPGDTVQRSFNLANTGNQSLASVALTTTASPTSLLDTDATNGLQMVIDKCSTPWVESGSSPAFTYSCGATNTSVIASRAVIGTNLAMAGLDSLTNGGTDHLRVTLTLPAATGNTFQGLNSTVSYSFTGTQRTATNK